MSGAQVGNEVFTEDGRRECGYDLKRMEYISRPEPCVSFGFSHPDSGRGFRVGGVA